MRKIIIVIYFLSLSVYSQTSELCDLAFSKKENFSFLTIFDEKIPDKFLIIDSTLIWNSKTFFLENTNLKDQSVIDKINVDEHHPYHSMYLFSEKALDDLIADNEKEKLSQITASIKSKKIQLKGSNYETIKKFKRRKGFYFLISEPMYSTSEKFAFLEITARRKGTFLGEKEDECFGYITIMFQKNGNGKWEQIGAKKNVIL
jgi:hypothetical protein